MNRTTFARGAFTAAFTLIAFFGMAQYNNSPTLGIGDAAPAIKVEAWVRGEPVTGFEKGKVYVLDFWATWCGGCIASFPHISVIAEKYKGRVSFSSVSVYEAIDSIKKDPVTKVKDFLATPRGQNLKFSVCVDGNSNRMCDAWIKPLRRAGVPTTFVIDQEGKVAWVDVNLDHLDWVLAQVLAKKWDREKAAQIMKQRDAIEDLAFKSFRDKGAAHTKDLEAVLTACESFDKLFPDRMDAVRFYKFMALQELHTDKVADVLGQMAADPLSRYINLSDAAGLSLQRKNLTKKDYIAIARVQERLLLNEYPGVGYGGKSVSAYENLAKTYDMAGDASNAAASLKKAIAMANGQEAPADQIKKLQEALDKYQAETARSK